MNETIAELRKAREAAAAKVGALLAECQAAGFQESDEYNKRWDAATAEYEAAQKKEADAIAAQTRTADRLAMRERLTSDATALDAAMRGRLRPDHDPRQDPRSRAGATARVSSDDFRHGLRVWARSRMPEYVLEDEDVAVARRCRINLASDELILPNGGGQAAWMDRVQAAMRTGLNPREAIDSVMASWNTMTPESAGVLTQPPTLVREVEINRLQWGGLLQVATTRTTATGEDLILPFINDTANKGRRISEDGPLGTEKSPSVGAKAWGAKKYTSDAIIVTYEMTRDTFFDLEQFIGAAGGERLGRIENDECTNGTGVAMPRGIAFAAPVTVIAASATAITSDEVISLEMSLDDGYKAGGTVGFMMNKTTLALLRKLKDLEGRYLLQMGQEGTTNRLTLFNYPVFINYDMPAPTAGLKALLFGDMRRYIVRRVGGQRIVRDPYTLLMSRDAVQFAVVEYMDGNLWDTGTPPVVALRML